MADSFTITLVRRPRINPNALRFDESDMKEVGETFQKSVRVRVAKSINSFDRVMPPLKPKYLKAKLLRGKAGIRDLNLTGGLLDAIAVTSEPGRAVVGIRGAFANVKFRVNQFLSPWWGVSPTDGRAVDQVIENKANEKMRDVFR